MMHKRRLATVSLAFVAVLSSCGSSQSRGATPRTPVPPVSACGKAGPSSPISLAIAHSGKGSIALVPVCFGKEGPYQFILDTGAPASLVDSHLAAHLHLATSPARAQAVTVGCLTTNRQVVAPDWSLGGVRLSPQSVLAAKVPGLAGGVTPAGVIGGDILSRFGAIRIDLRAKQLAVLAPEAAPPRLATVLQGSADAVPPPLLVRQTPRASALLTVVRSNASAVASAKVTFVGYGSYRFILATGSAQSSVVPALATSLRMRRLGSVANSAGAGCDGRVDEVQSGPWSVGSASQPTTPFLTLKAEGTNQAGVTGTLGSDVLDLYGSAVLDYRSAVLWLGAG